MLNECVSIFKKFHVRLFTCNVQINFVTKNGSIFFWCTVVYCGLQKGRKSNHFFSCKARLRVFLTQGESKLFFL